MGITGPVIPKHFTPTASTANNPSLSVDASQFEEGEIFTCLQTGRMWVKGKNGSLTALRQILPVTRNNGSPSVISTEVTNDAGAMKVANASGSTDGKWNAFDQLLVDANGVTTPNIVSAQVVADSTGKLQAGTVSNTPLSNNVTIGSTSALTTLLIATVDDIGVYKIDLHCTFTHNNACDVSFGIQYRASATDYYIPRAHTVSIGNSASYASGSCSAIMTLSPSVSVRAVCVATTTGVTVRKEPLFSFPYLPATPPQTSFATYMTVQRVG